MFYSVGVNRGQLLCVYFTGGGGSRDGVRGGISLKGSRDKRGGVTGGALTRAMQAPSSVATSRRLHAAAVMPKGEQHHVYERQGGHPYWVKRKGGTAVFHGQLAKLTYQLPGKARSSRRVLNEKSR